jgi:hypothetical protein
MPMAGCVLLVSEQDRAKTDSMEQGAFNVTGYLEAGSFV